jgi:hypothetical protein
MPLSKAEQAAIAEKIRPCVPDTQPFAGMSIHLVLGTNAQGRTEFAFVSAVDEGKLQSDPHYREFALSVVRAALTPACSGLPLPAGLAGSPRRLDFVFSS